MINGRMSANADLLSLWTELFEIIVIYRPDILFWPPSGNANSGFATIKLVDLFSCQTRLSIEIIFNLTLAMSYEVSVHVLLRWVSVKRVYH